MVGGAVVAVVLVGAALLHLVQDNGRQSSSGRLSANTDQAGKRPSPKPSPSRPSASLGPVTPAAFAGSWFGQVKQPPTDTYNVSVTLVSGAAAGTVSYSGTDFSCSGVLNLTQTSSRKLMMSQASSKVSPAAITVR